MGEPSVILKSAADRRSRRPGSPEAAWRAVAWFGALLAVIALGDIALTWVPPRFGIPEWEFATAAASLSGLPLLSMGVAALLAAGFAGGRRRLVGWTAALLIALALAVVAVYLLFLSVAPLALRTASGEADVGLVKVIIKTSMLGIGFGGAYAVAGLAAIAHLRKHG